MTATAHKVLLIGEDSALLSDLDPPLRQAGFEVLIATDGRHGLDQAFRVRPDLIVCDLLHTTPNGPDLKALLDTDPLTADIPFIFLAAGALDVETLDRLAQGADDYLARPFTPDDLIRRINQLLLRHDAGRRRGRAEMAAETTQLRQFLYEMAQLVGRDGQTVEQLEVSDRSAEVWNLCSRADFEERLDQLSAGGGIRLPLTIVCFNLDGLDALAAETADALLLQTFDALLGAVDADSLLFRLGAGQFALLLHHDDELLDGIRETLQQALQRAGTILGIPPPGLSMGTAIACEDDRISARLREAEAALLPMPFEPVAR